MKRDLYAVAALAEPSIRKIEDLSRLPIEPLIEGCLHTEPIIPLDVLKWTKGVLPKPLFVLVNPHSDGFVKIDGMGFSTPPYTQERIYETIPRWMKKRTRRVEYWTKISTPIPGEVKEVITKLQNERRTPYILIEATKWERNPKPRPPVFEPLLVTLCNNYMHLHAHWDLSKAERYVVTEFAVSPNKITSK